MPVRSIVIDGRRVWHKTYPGGGRRRVSLALLGAVARRLGLAALRPPPHHTGSTAQATEARRLRELAGQGVRVPALIAEDAGGLQLGDLGDSLASRFQHARGDHPRIDALTRQAIDAIGDAHRRGAYFGQPVPRNMTIDDAGIGFIDFEEDPLEVMSLPQAQARDWLLFAFGVAKYYDDRPDALAQLLDRAFADETAEVGAQVQAVGERLHPLARVLRRLGRPARALAHSLFAIRVAAR